jgi:hypothetical protein
LLQEVHFLFRVEKAGSTLKKKSGFSIKLLAELNRECAKSPVGALRLSSVGKFPATSPLLKSYGRHFYCARIIGK